MNSLNNNTSNVEELNISKKKLDEELKLAFDMFDEDKSGAISKEEFGAFMVIL